MIRPLWAPLLLVSAISGIAAGADPVSIVPTLSKVNLSMSLRENKIDSADLRLELVTSFQHARLLGWEDARLVEASVDSGEKLIAKGTPEWKPNFGSENCENDLSIPLAVELTGFSRPPTRLTKLRIDAIAVLAYGGYRELVLPANTEGRTFASQDDKTATVQLTRKQDQWELICSTSLARRLMTVVLHNPKGDLVYYGDASQRHRNANRMVVDVPIDDIDQDARPVLILAERVELRPVRLMGDGMALFSADADPELLPLGKDHADYPALIVPGAALP
jgi:hypothetical protein